ncbi:DUF262 domain-containing protein [Empedobacter falsenii]
MDYNFIEFSVKELVDLIKNEKIDLNPSYQRNFIWGPKDQKELIDTILLEFPLPSFFLYKKPDGYYEMVDGQQRSKTIFRFVQGQISSSLKTNSQTFDKIDQEKFLNYKLPIILIENLKPSESLKDYYVWINKKGIHLNPSEVNKSEFHDTNFLRLATEALNYQNLIELDLFSDAVSKRMNDRSFIEELLGYLQVGIKEKKKSVEFIYSEEDITNEEYITLNNRFEKIIDIIYEVQKIKPIKTTRYKQKNDFYTLFNFINENIDCSLDLLIEQYKILIFIDGKDSEGRQHIRPTNDNCEAFKNYALNCVSQSNSKIARDKRLHFFNSVLKNVNISNNDILIEILNYYEEEIDIKLNLKKIDEFELIDVNNYL